MRFQQNFQPLASGWRSSKLQQLTANDDQANAAQIAAYYRIRNVFDQCADTEKTDEYLDQPVEDTEDGNHQHDGYRRHPLRHELEGKSRKHRRSGAQGVQIRRSVPPKVSAIKPRAVAPRIPASAPKAAYCGLIAEYTVTPNATAAGKATSMAAKPP